MIEHTLTENEKEKAFQIEKQIAEAEKNLFEENYKQVISRYKSVRSKFKKIGYTEIDHKIEELFIKLLEANHDYLKYLLKIKHTNQGVFFFEEEAKQ